MQQQINIKIIHTSDVHGHFFPYDFINRKNALGSLARVSTYIKNERKKIHNNIILLDNGDILQGQPTCYHSNFINTQQTNLAAAVVNYLGYDAQGIGNHDIETGHPVYDKWIKELQCPTLAANIIDTSTKQPYTHPYTIINKGLIKIAILGLTTPAIPSWLSEDLWEGLRFEDITKSAQYWVEHIQKKENPHLLIGLFHSGQEGGINTEIYKENASLEVARLVNGFDLIFMGHDHTKCAKYIKNHFGKEVLCLNPSSDALFISEAEIQFNIENNQVIKKQLKATNIDIRNEMIDKDFINHFDKEIKEITAFTNKKIGIFKNTIYSKDAYFGNSAFSDFIHQIQLQITQADLSFNAPLAFDISIKKGDIHISDLFNLYKYENQIYMLEMSGKEIKEYLEMSYGQWCNTMITPKDNIMLLTNSNHEEKIFFKNLTFNFDSAMGICYTVDVRNPYGKKINILSLQNGKPFDMEQRYAVAMNSYRGNGGGELLTKGAGIPIDELPKRILFKSSQDQRYYIMKTIEREKILDPQAQNNWKFIPEEWTKEALMRDKMLIFGK